MPRHSIACLIGAYLIGALLLVVAGFAGWRFLNGSSDRSATPTTPTAPAPSAGTAHPLLGRAPEARVPLAGGDARHAAVLADLLADAEAPSERAVLVVDYPLEGSVFPPDFTRPTFLWHDPASTADTCLIVVTFDPVSGTRPEDLRLLVRPSAPPRGEPDRRALGETNEIHVPDDYQASANAWTPDAGTWQTIRRRSTGGRATLTFHGFDSLTPDRVLSQGTVRISTAKDPVGAPIFYRDVPLMPSEGEEGVIQPLGRKALPIIGWRLRDVSKPESRLLLTGMPSCANCHSFSRDGRTLGMDVDGPQGDKGTYAITHLEERTVIPYEDVITWNSYDDKPEGHKTIGFLSRMSPDGRYAVTTLNEEVYVVNFRDFGFLQVFYPTRGILAWYDKKSRRMKSLPGADDPAYVHCDPVWTPDGRALVFARAEARDPYEEGRPLATHAGDENETPIRYDLYRIPFAEGRGGTAERIAGASQNGMSNTFPKVSPDGKWVVFVQCRNGQLMRPDSRLWIVPLAGGEAREMRCNTSLMNSWHSFSPNGRWMVFSSKVNTPYTQMFLTHIDDRGHDTPPILIPNSTAPNRAVNLPEFVNRRYEDLLSIEVPAVNHHRHFQEGVDLLNAGRPREAAPKLRRAVELDEEFSQAHAALGVALEAEGRHDEAIAHYERALAINPHEWRAVTNLGLALIRQNRMDEAIAHYETALESRPKDAQVHNNLGMAYSMRYEYEKALRHYELALAADPYLLEARKNLGQVALYLGDEDLAHSHFAKVLEASPDDALALEQTGRWLHRRGDVKALELLERLLALRPEDPQALSALAWVLATHGDSKVRDGTRALRLAKKARGKAGAQSVRVLDALAAAHAEVGAFTEAEAIAAQAVDLAEDEGTARERVEAYRMGKAWRVGP